MRIHAILCFFSFSLYWLAPFFGITSARPYSIAEYCWGLWLIGLILPAIYQMTRFLHKIVVHFFHVESKLTSLMIFSWVAFVVTPLLGYVIEVLNRHSAQARAGAMMVDFVLYGTWLFFTVSAVFLSFAAVIRFFAQHGRLSSI